ncbi:carotenoid 1,2-hydratase [Lacisediminimonas sp.]|uniref:lipocalin-like domain-containing protein n=1 Tax=Lacisediminimonas sp. TaxID=3060582 RepID=UPI00271BC206|nr:carotenoid 1,2-hydratase [Lacisediminimonas sp.]MDO8300005.1 carotenoid 1,2-hydratase [Lacisediminimonas sp.]
MHCWKVVAMMMLVCVSVGGGRAQTAGPATAAAPNPTATSLAAASKGKPVAFAQVTPDKPLQFPADFGAHPDFRTEWWYATGWLKLPDGMALGFQVTFFRSRTEHAPDNPSRFAPKQLIIAHAAISDPRDGKLLHDQKSAREGWGLAYAKTGDTDVKLDDWSLQRQPDGRYLARIRAQEFSLALDFKPTQGLMLQGDQGYSRKGPRPGQASYYYSEPQLQVSGQLTRGGKSVTVSGQAWLDHEWSSTVLDERAVGWDWVGANLDDGSALMMFRIRGKNGEQIWAHAALRDAAGRITRFGPESVSFKPLRSWRSPRTGANYPVSAIFRTGDTEWRLTPLQDDQELDSRMSTGTVYWEGAIKLEKNGRPAGNGYLELTGYEKALKL